MEKQHKLCYVLPQYYDNSAENFFHIANLLEELGKKCYFLIVDMIEKKRLLMIWVLNNKGIKWE